LVGLVFLWLVFVGVRRGPVAAEEIEFVFDLDAGGVGEAEGFGVEFRTGESGGTIGFFGAETIITKAGFGELGKGGEDASVVFGFVGELLHVRGGIEFGEEIVHLFDGDGEAGFADFGGIGIGKDVAREVETGLHLIEPILVFQPIFESAAMPGFDVIAVEMFDGFADFFDDLSVGATVEKELVDLVPDGFRELGDEAVAPP